ncbi:hypothetical protein [Hydrocarboniphaga sp.]|uniref:hypothetical protein n=1 Tax=Hydrocarboniphaga sp. TaxID=2033016 RepID=UPI003D0F9C2F
MTMMKGAVVVPMAAALLLAAADPAAACSTCKCGDYTITLLGAEKPYSGRFRLGLDYLLRSETAGAGLDGQKTDEQRATLGLAYSLTQDITLALQVPFVRKQIESPNLAKQSAQGLGDIDVTGRWVAYRSPGGDSGRHLAGLRAGLRLPTADQIKDHGELLDIDVQPDAGATVPSLGGWYGYYRYPWFATVSATYFKYTEGHQDFRGGDVALISALAQYGITQSVALQLGVDARQSQKNQFSGVDDPDSGGFLTMGFAGAALRIGDDFLINAGAQVPLIQNLNGEQDEDPALRVGVTYDF